MPPRPIRPRDKVQPVEKKDNAVDPEAQSSKRRVVPTACVPCRRRKSKCDGGKPVCSSCSAVYRTECFYDADSDPRRKGPLKRDIQSLQEQSNALDVIVASLRSLPDLEATSLLHSLRGDTDLDVLANTLRNNVNLPPSFGYQTLEADFAEHLSAATTPLRSGDESSSFPWDETSDDQELLSSAGATWFRTVQDAEFVQHLLDLYFTWIHPFCPFLSREHFLRDMGRGRKEFCSVMLVNTVLAFACHYSSQPTARTDRSDPGTAGDQFFAVAKEELDNTEVPSLTTIQALGIMSMRESSHGRDSAGYQYAGRCVRMALEMGLHLSVMETGSNAAHDEARKIAFWSVFNLETLLSVCVGRMSQLPRAAADVHKPAGHDRIEHLWAPYVEAEYSPDEDVRQPVRTGLFLSQLSSLSEVASDMVSSFYAPKEPFTSVRLANAYERYQLWYRALPSVFRVENTTLPHVIVLHMYYHACVLHLFRPYIKLELEGASASPRDRCTVSANQISELMATLRAMYGLRRTMQLVPSLLLSGSTIHLLNLPAEDATTHLRQSIIDLQAMTSNHRFAARCIDIIRSLANKWNIDLPKGTAAQPLVSHDGLPSPSSSNFWTATIPQQDAFTGREGGSSRAAATYLQSVQGLPQTPLYNAVYQQTTMHLNGNVASNAFWTPFPAQPMPLPHGDMISRYAMSPDGESGPWTSAEQFQGTEPQTAGSFPHWQAWQ